MDDEEKDLRKEIEDLEKLIEQVKDQQNKNPKKSNKQSSPGVIKIDLGSRYSTNLYANLFVSFLVNFLLFYTLNSLFIFAEIKNNYLYLLLALLFTIFEEAYKTILLKKYVKLVIYSSGLIFFLINIAFFYFIDLVVFPSSFSFSNYLYPLGFVLIFQIVRIFFKVFYNSMVKLISQKIVKNKQRR